jgi:hypothetical protein
MTDTDKSTLSGAQLADLGFSLYASPEAVRLNSQRYKDHWEAFTHSANETDMLKRRFFSQRNPKGKGIEVYSEMPYRNGSEFPVVLETVLEGFLEELGRAYYEYLQHFGTPENKVLTNFNPVWYEKMAADGKTPIYFIRYRCTFFLY